MMTLRHCDTGKLRMPLHHQLVLNHSINFFTLNEQVKKKKTLCKCLFFFIFHVKPIANDAPVSLVLLLHLHGTKYYRHHVN